ncbi:MAG: MoxR family ATPase [Firmicutes bacterium]|nr:MoxR family ATPase [[Eubacterium] siraeum]MCM1487535.1 MoxR family ATPase [Bacillota bacterium]
MEISSSQVYSKLNATIDEIEKVIIGKRNVITLLVVALLAGGHVMIEDVPGTGKTTLATALGRSTGLKFKRAQFTPDVTASDITGFNLFNKESNQFEFRPGMAMTNILLADEINRTSPKTQSALLEAMEERNVTVDGHTYRLPRPFIVIATQNELGFVGTFPLPEAQLDRFMIKVSMGYPSTAEELKILAGKIGNEPMDDVKAVCTAEELEQYSQLTGQVTVDSRIAQYIVSFTSATRNHPAVLLGASPRASLALMRCSQALALISGRTYVVPEDVSSLIPYVLGHRIHIRQEAKIKGITAKNVLEDVKNSIMHPFGKVQE